ncbi:hypothetical protein [Nodosilinea sp. E11]|uniref:hypothetical protein n=1 Tax=Nodosilinea sp. E11 TaxID=3037479 RepID=UPI002934D2DD|nr:hypothetical protein [Nodosilinea sp. E11]WOD37068.1 hypothetical protein RRF56_01010 [Nodosilinea sp. E11]
MADLSDLTDASPPLVQALDSRALGSQDIADLSRLADKIFEDPVALRHLCDRVYALMQQDLQRQRERTRPR